MGLVSTCVRFGRFELDLQSGELREKGLRVHIADQPLQVLIFLLNNPGKLVTREELRHQLWPTNTFVDFEHGLNAAVKRLREALGDTAEHPQFIETIPRHGYRFIVPVNVIPAVDRPQMDRPLQQESGKPREGSRSRSWLVGLLALGVLAATFSTLAVRTKLEQWFAPSRQPIRSLVVLPFENLNNDPERDYLADGLTEALITEFGKVRSLRVISRQSVLRSLYIANNFETAAPKPSVSAADR